MEEVMGREGEREREKHTSPRFPARRTYSSRTCCSRGEREVSSFIVVVVLVVGSGLDIVVYSLLSPLSRFLLSCCCCLLQSWVCSPFEQNDVSGALIS
jgi:hypothetical protein